MYAAPLHRFVIGNFAMATDGSTPPPCDPDIFKRGVSVGVFETFGANHFENLVRQVAAACGKPVDWSYSGGRAVVRAFPEDADHVRPFVYRMITPVIAGKRQEALNADHSR